MSDTQIEKLVEGLRTAHQRVLSAVEGISENEAHLVPQDGEWTVAQLLAHIAEIQTFWTGKALLIIREEDPNITRSDVENDVRLAAVTDHSGDSTRDLLESMVNAHRQAITSVRTIRPEDLDRVGHRGEGNPITVKGVIEFLARHIEEHAGQIQESRRLIAGKREGPR